MRAKAGWRPGTSDGPLEDGVLVGSSLVVGLGKLRPPGRAKGESVAVLPWPDCSGAVYTEAVQGGALLGLVRGLAGLEAVVIGVESIS